MMQGPIQQLDDTTAAARGQTAIVKVYDPCTCRACSSGQRWFYCDRAAYPVARYACDPYFVDSPDGPPDLDQLRAIEATHPGCTFVYLGDLPGDEGAKRRRGTP